MCWLGTRVTSDVGPVDRPSSSSTNRRSQKAGKTHTASPAPASRVAVPPRPPPRRSTQTTFDPPSRLLVRLSGEASVQKQQPGSTRGQRLPVISPEQTFWFLLASLSGLDATAKPVPRSRGPRPKAPVSPVPCPPLSSPPNCQHRHFIRCAGRFASCFPATWPCRGRIVPGVGLHEL